MTTNADKTIRNTTIENAAVERGNRGTTADSVWLASVILFAAFSLSACDLLGGSQNNGAGFQQNNPFVPEPPEIVTAHVPRVAMSGNGSAMVLYYDVTTRSGSSVTNRVSRLRTFRYDLASGNNSDDAILEQDSDEPPSGDSVAPLLASDQSGTAVAFYDRNVGLCRFVPPQGWSCATPGSANAFAMDGAGRILSAGIVSVNNGGTYALRHYALGGWEAEQNLSSDKLNVNYTGGQSERDSLAYWSGGVGFAVWTDSTRTVRASRFLRTTSTWEPPVALGTTENAGSNSIPAPHVALARNASTASAIAVWFGVTRSIEFSRYLPGSGWQSVQTIAGATGFSSIELAMSANGDAVLVGFRPPNVAAIRYVNGTWGSLETLGQANDDHLERPRIVVDGAGNGLAVWVESKPTESAQGKITSNRLIRGAGWEGPRQIGSTPLAISGIGTGASDVAAFDVDMDATGRAMIVWVGDAGASFPLGSTRLQSHVSGLFNLGATPAAITAANNGDNKLTNVSVVRSAFTGSIDLQVLGCPTKVICSLGKSQLATGDTDTTLTFITNSADPATAGSYTVRVQATGGPQNSDTSINLTLTPAAPSLPTSLLTVNVSGNGRVVSTPAGIDCLGPQLCTGQFNRNQVVTLTATPDLGQTFGGYGGDPDCTDGSLTLSANATCTATFVVSAMQWVLQGGALNVTATTTAARAQSPEIEMGSDGIPVGAFTENGLLAVRRLVGTTWTTLGSSLGNGQVDSISLTIDSSGAPVVAWDESNAVTSIRDVFAARWNGSAWILLGGGAVDVLQTADASAPTIRARSSDIAIAWTETTTTGGSRIVVRTWNGSAWVNAGSTEGPLPTNTSVNSLSPKLAVSAGNTIAVVWEEDFGVVRVAELLSGVWTPTSTGPVTVPLGGTSFYTDIAYSAVDGLLVVAQQQSGGTFNVRRWSGGAWSNLGTARGNVSFSGTPQLFGLAFSHGRTGSIPLLAYSRRNAAGSVHEFVVERLSRGPSATDWVIVGSPIVPTSRHNRPGLESEIAIVDATLPIIAAHVRGSLPTTGATDDSIVAYKYQ